MTGDLIKKLHYSRGKRFVNDMKFSVASLQTDNDE